MQQAGECSGGAWLCCTAAEKMGEGSHRGSLQQVTQLEVCEDSEHSLGQGQLVWRGSGMEKVTSGKDKCLEGNKQGQRLGEVLEKED